jgi:cell wall-associated NlpC family hydrolase
MNKTLWGAIGVLIVQGSVSPIWAGQTKHHPWLMFHSAKSVESPSSDAQDLISKEGATRSPAVGRTRDDGNRVVQQAMHYEGTRYKFGGTTTRGMDCSGLVSRVWSDLKMKRIPRVSSALYNSGRPVHLQDLRPGDLVFFKNTYKSGISHVGVYAGNNKFVHAANHRKGVTITRLSDPYYQLHYAGARRLY